MDFTYDDEQQALREAVRGLLATAYADHEARRRTVADEPGVRPRPVGPAGRDGHPRPAVQRGPTAASVPGPSRSGSCARSWAACSPPSPTSRRSCTPAASSPPSGPPSRRPTCWAGSAPARSCWLRPTPRPAVAGPRARTAYAPRCPTAAGRSTAWPTPSWAVRPPTTSSSPPPCPTAAQACSWWTPPRRRSPATPRPTSPARRASGSRRPPPRRSASPAATCRRASPPSAT